MLCSGGKKTRGKSEANDKIIFKLSSFLPFFLFIHLRKKNKKNLPKEFKEHEKNALNDKSYVFFWGLISRVVCE